MKVLIFIPSHNEELNIENTVHKIKTVCPDMDFIVVNDGSTDQTESVCRKNGFPVISLPVNLGLAGAFQTGIRYAFEHGYDAAVQIDGDGQHEPVYLYDMIGQMQRENADIIIGSRFVNRKKPHSMRTFGSSLISFAIKLTTKQYIGDPTSGMRLYNHRMLELFANNINYGPEPDTMAFLIRKGYCIREMQVKMYERTAGESYLNPIRSVRYMIEMFVSILLVQFFR